MSELATIRTRMEELARTLDRLSAGAHAPCEPIITGGTVAAPHPDLTELEETRTKAEELKRDLAALKNRSKLDPEVRELEAQLEQVLNRYYWLWHKCKDNAG